MARKEVDFVISDEGRDKGKVFHIVEMSAMRAEKWGWKALQAAQKGGVIIDDSILSMGMQAVAAVGISGIMNAPFHEIEPLMDEIMGCVTIKPDPRNLDIKRPILEEDIEEWKTMLNLRVEVLKLHTGFFQPGAQSSSISETPAPSPSPSAQTYHVRSPRSLRQTKPA